MSKEARSLYRPDEGRWLAGVAVGLGRRWGIPTWIIRVAFVLLCFTGGLGLLLYVAGWLLIPREGETGAIVLGWVGTGQTRKWVGVILVGLAVIFLASETGLIRSSLAFAVVLIGIGVMLYRGDLNNRDSRQDSSPAPVQATASSSAQTMPSSEESEPPIEPPSPPPAPIPSPARETSYLGRLTVGCAVLALGVLGLLDSTVPGFRPEFHHYVALLVAVVGLGLVVGGWFGRSRSLVVLGWILIPLLLLLLPLAGFLDRGSFRDLDFRSAEYSVHRPYSVQEVLDDYDMGVGSLLIDLTNVDFAGHTVMTEVDVGIGEILVHLPDSVSAEIRGDVGIGALRVGDQEQNGLGVDTLYYLPGSEGRLVLDADVGIGRIVVSAWPVGYSSEYP